MHHGVVTSNPLNMVTVSDLNNKCFMNLLCSWFCYWGHEENYVNLCKDSQSSGWDSNPRPPETGVPTTSPWQSVWLCVLTSLCSSSGWRSQGGTKIPRKHSCDSKLWWYYSVRTPGQVGIPSSQRAWWWLGQQSRWTSGAILHYLNAQIMLLLSRLIEGWCIRCRASSRTNQEEEEDVNRLWGQMMGGTGQES